MKRDSSGEEGGWDSEGSEGGSRHFKLLFEIDFGLRAPEARCLFLGVQPSGSETLTQNHRPRTSICVSVWSILLVSRPGARGTPEACSNVKEPRVQGLVLSSGRQTRILNPSTHSFLHGISQLRKQVR